MNHFYMLPERAFLPLGGRMTLEGGLFGGDSSPPPAPNYSAGAAEQAQASKEITTQQNYANRPRQTDAFGSVTDWTTSAGTDPSTGQAITNWEQKQTLSPELQKAYQDQLSMQKGRSELAGGFQGRVADAYKNPFSYAGMPERTGTPEQTTQTTDEAGFSGERQRIEQGLFDRMAPEHQRAQSQLDQKLANQGITEGSEAYQQARQELGDQQSRERFNAMTMGGQEQQRLQQMLLAQQGQAYGQGMQGAGFQNTNRQAAIAEEAQRRGMSLNEMNALMSGQQVNTPQMPGFQAAQAPQTPNILGAMGQQYSAGMDQYNAQQQQSQNTMSGLGQLAGTAASLFMMSDRRLKSNIVRVGTHPRGVGIYEYDIFGQRQRGVMAQELLQVAPELVALHPSGYMMVNYGGL